MRVEESEERSSSREKESREGVRVEDERVEKDCE